MRGLVLLEFVFISLYLRGCVRLGLWVGGGRGLKKRLVRLSNQLGFQGLRSAFTILIKHSSNFLQKKKKKTHKETSLMKSELESAHDTRQLPFQRFPALQHPTEICNIEDTPLCSAAQTWAQSSYVMIRQL